VRNSTAGATGGRENRNNGEDIEASLPQKPAEVPKLDLPAKSPSSPSEQDQLRSFPYEQKSTVGNGMPAPVAQARSIGVEGRSLTKIDDLQAYLPKSDRSYLRFGIQYEGWMGFLMVIGFATKDQDGHWCLSPNYNREALSPPGVFHWLSSYEPKIEHDHNKPLYTENITGYDCNVAVRGWLKANEHEGLSVCEVILVDDRLHHLRSHVGIANVFLSRLNKNDPFVEAYQMVNMRPQHEEQLPPPVQRFW
jgi:hypothetical protein